MPLPCPLGDPLPLPLTGDLGVLDAMFRSALREATSFLGTFRGSSEAFLARLTGVGTAVVVADLLNLARIFCCALSIASVVFPVVVEGLC